MDSVLFLIGLACLALVIGSILGAIAYFSQGGLRADIEKLKIEIKALKSQIADGGNTLTSPEGEEAKPFTTEKIEPPEEPELSDAVAQDEEGEATSEPEPAIAARVSDDETISEDVEKETVPQTPKIDTESNIGGKLSIWVGGLTLAIGGLYLAKYSIEAGLLGPQARVTLGFLFGLLVAAGGEWTRRRPDRFSLAGFESANIPAILSGVGIFIMFGSIYAAHSLYGLIGPTTSFIILAILALASLLISLLHGPVLAALGLLASYVVPFLINSDSANVPVLASYVLLVSAAAMYVAWYRAWLWCALTSVAAMLCYSFLLEIAEGDENSIIVGIYILGTLALTYLSLVWSVHERKPDAEMAIDWQPTIALSALFVPVLFHFSRDQSLAVHIIELALLLALPLAASYRYPALRFVTIVPSILAVLKFWTMFAPHNNTVEKWQTWADQLGNQIAGPNGKLYPSESFVPYLTDTTYMMVATLTVLVLIGFAVLTAPKARARLVTASVSTSVSLAIFISCYVRIAELEQSTQFALVGLILFALFHLQANYYHNKLDEKLPARDATIAVALIGSLVSLALAVSIYFSGVGLTIALGLITAATMLTHMRYPLNGLRIFAVIAVAPYIVRLLWQPFIDKSALLDATPFFNILTLGYGIPALGFIFASYIATKHKDDLWTQGLQALAIISSVITITMLALHAIDPSFSFNTYRSAVAASATLVMVGGAFSLGLTRIAKRKGGSSRILRWAAEGLGILGMLIGALALFIGLNPMLPMATWEYSSTDVHMGEGLLFNLIGYAYALPFILFALIVWQGRASKSKYYQWTALGFTALLGFFWINLTIRHAFHGVKIASAPILQAENYTYSLVWLIIGIIVLFLGIRWRQQLLRKASGLIILAVVLKAFIIDMSHLEGVLRAISFIGLGGTLMGIGFVYQRALRGMFATQEDDGDKQNVETPSE
ncbi:DUF2339 domain-containing protein [Lentilitoribacter sp. Alg239-R112]|uniref:DUF2339 domain-containing protein n=1 Tax=Lentilitoribacter sp. Alg239-R112 TaxID=2305987 RepID=UPI0013A6E608|nr:DUF2339 domain-containing protein [Lentilitoribacter sp. Alg239-R112]